MKPIDRGNRDLGRTGKLTHSAEQLQRLKLGAACTAAAGLLGFRLWGEKGLVSGAAFGGIATGLQLLAAQVMVRTGVKPSVDHLAVYVMGMGLRFLGVVALYALVTKYPSVFAAAPSAVGYLVTVIPLLYLETRLAR